MQAVRIALLQLIFPTAIAIAYFSLTAILVPRQFEDWPDLDAYFDHRRTWIVGLLLVANVLLIILTLSITLGSHEDLISYALRSCWLIGSYIVLLFSRRRLLDIIASLSVIVFYVFTYISRQFI